MTALECRHAPELRTRHVCEHLLADIEEDHCQLLLEPPPARAALAIPEHAMVCEQRCARLELDELLALELVPVCPACFAAIEEESYWDTGELGVLGHLRPRVAAPPRSFRHTPLPHAPRIEPSAALPLGQGWLVRDVGGALLRLDALGRARELAQPRLPSFSTEPKLHASPCGRWAALADAKQGLVWSLDDAQPVLELARGDYHSRQTPFPLAFAELEGRSVLIHATDWNRVDLFELETRRNLSARELGPRAADYFHGRLDLSPNASRVISSGWVWQPAGVYRAWDLGPWLGGNAFESEDGPSSCSFGPRDYSWHEPLCWLDERRVIKWGYGNDDLNLRPAACIYDTRSGELERWFPGPERGSLHLLGDLLIRVGAEQHRLDAWTLEGLRVAHTEGCQVHAGNRLQLLTTCEGRLQLTWL